jgi:hypothetical protein
MINKANTQNISNVFNKPGQMTTAAQVNNALPTETRTTRHGSSRIYDTIRTGNARPEQYLNSLADLAKTIIGPSVKNKEAADSVN